MWEEDRWAPAKRRLTPLMPVVTPFITPVDSASTIEEDQISVYFFEFAH